MNRVVAIAGAAEPQVFIDGFKVERGTDSKNHKIFVINALD